MMQMTKDKLQDFLSLLPQHNFGFTLRHNPHKSSFESVEDYTADFNDGNDHSAWISEEQRNIAITYNDFWELQFYPSNSVGFYLFYAHSLEALLLHVKDVSE